MTPSLKLMPNYDGSYDLWIEYSRNDVEFAEEFDVKKEIKTNSQKILETALAYSKRVKIKSVKILVSGALIATVAFSSFISAFAGNDRYSMGYLYSGTDIQQIEYVNQTNNALDVVSPSYFDIREDGSLKLNYLSPYFIKTMHDKGIKVVPFLSNHWNRTAGINALKNVELLSTQIAEYVKEYDLDGVNVDIENVTHEQRDQYTKLVRLLREKIPADKEISVAVAANPNNWQTGWHGSYDYTALAQYADHLLVMAYDEHYEGGDAGSVAGIDFVENSIKYALSKTSSDKIVIGIPFYGRVWSLDSNRIVGKGVSSKTIQQILKNCESTVTYDEKSQSVKAEFTVTKQSGNFTVGGDFVLEPGKYVVWYEDDRSYQSKLSLINKYNLKGAGAWSLGQEDISVWEHYEAWLNGDDDADTEASEPTAPTVSQPTVPTVPTVTEPTSPSNPTEPTSPTVSEPSKPAQENYTEAWIAENQTRVSVYKNSNLRGKIIGYVSGGTKVSVSKKSDTVYKIKLSDGQEGYIASHYLTFEKNPDTSVPQEPSEEYFIYEVKSGDTLWRISQQYLGSGSRYTEIMKLNDLKSEIIYAGMKLKIPVFQNSDPEAEETFREYTVKKGDTLWKIAKSKLGSGDRYTEIIVLNRLTGTTIYAGQVLKLPNN